MSARKLGLLLGSVVVVLLGSTTATAAENPIEIGSRRELFVDRYLIGDLKNATLQLHAPQPAGIALTWDQPWEGPHSGCTTILQDRDVYRMYYRGQRELPSAAECTCYAESSDGISWAKPILQLHEMNGSRENNVILHGPHPASHNFAPFIDTRPSVPNSERYKAVCGHTPHGLMAYKSSDGIHWEKLQPEPILTDGAFDTHNVAFWSGVEDCYVCYIRSWTEGTFGGLRTISRTTSKDFVNWSAPQTMEFGDAPREHLYTNQTLPYFRAPHLYIALPMRFFPGRTALTKKTLAALPIDPAYRKYAKKECSDGVLMTSRGGNRYDRTFLEAFMRPGLDPGNWVSRSISAAHGIIQTGPAEMSIYYIQHDGQSTSHLARFILRLDGFASVRAPYAGGELITKPLLFDGHKLELNLSTSAAGSVQVEIQDLTGAPISGFALEDCQPMIGDTIQRIVAWGTNHDVSELSGKPVRLRFVMRDADLYSFCFAKPADGAGDPK